MGTILEPLGLTFLGKLTGLLHDLGKYTMLFRTYIEKAANGEPVRKGSVNHTFAGVIFVLERYQAQAQNIYWKLTRELAAYAIGAHHGLFDCIGENGEDGFARRLQKDRAELHYQEAVANFLKECAPAEEIDRYFTAAVQEVEAFIGTGPTRYYLGMLCRVVVSALIDADRCSTADFMMNREARKTIRPDWEQQLNYMERKLKDFDGDNPIIQARSRISELCREFAEGEGGVYRLDVPTGSGKTLSSLRYALAHAIKRKKTRLFFVIPLLSVIEQNAEVIKRYVADPEIVLEHHSNIVFGEDQAEELGEYELLTENWQQPVVITTLVQLLNALFHGKTTAIRRMHSLCNSVIVIDEIQTLPHNMVSIMNMAINFLVKYCRATVLLCSATQPCLDETSYPIEFGIRSDLVPRTPELWKPFQRTVVKNLCRPYGYSPEELAQFALELIEERRSLLLICNTKAAASQLYFQMKSAAGDFRLFHLSNAMCMQHRLDTLKEIKACLKRKERILCVATQLVEAGVDFSFACVIRCLAGMDSIAQAAGRCNRDNEYGRLCDVYIVNLRSENTTYLQDIKLAQDAADELLNSYARNPEAYRNDLLSAEAISYYYQRFFNKPNIKNQLEYPVQTCDSDLYEMLSSNADFMRRRAAAQGQYPYLLRQAFQTAGKEFHVFEEETVDVIVPYEAGKQIISDLFSEKARKNLKFREQRLKDAKLYTISIFQYQLRILEKEGGLQYGDSFLCLQENFYNNETGLDLTGGNTSFCHIGD